jgi:hypothetical protein
VGRNQWKSQSDLILEGEKATKWEDFVGMLKSYFISLTEYNHDSLAWAKNSINETYTIKLGYLTLVEVAFQDIVCWWWSEVWKFNALVKVTIIYWLTLSKNMLTWEEGL